MKYSRRRFYKYDFLRKVFTKNIQTEMSHVSLSFSHKPRLNKIFLRNDQEKFHITILFNDYNQELDIHKSITLPGKDKEYISILKIKYYRILRLFADYRYKHAEIVTKHLSAYTIQQFQTSNSLLFPLQNEKLETELVNVRKREKYRLASSIHPRSIDTWFKISSQITIDDGHFFIQFEEDFKELYPICYFVIDWPNSICYSFDIEMFEEMFKEIANSLEHQGITIKKQV